MKIEHNKIEVGNSLASLPGFSVLKERKQGTMDYSSQVSLPQDHFTPVRAKPKRNLCCTARMKLVRFTFSILLIACYVGLQGQIPDSILEKQAVPAVNVTFDSVPAVSTITPVPSDSVIVKKRGFIGRIFKEDYPNPKKALLLSLAVPGGGQIYNKRWWKLPFVYGAYTGLVLAIDFNTYNYRRFRDAYIAELAKQPHEFSNTGLDANDLRRIRDGYDKNKQLSYIGLFAVHLVQTAEAFVDCHLKTFDVSEDLSLKIRPTMNALPTGTPFFGIGLSLGLSSSSVSTSAIP